jgi:hypothetical protein
MMVTTVANEADLPMQSASPWKSLSEFITRLNQSISSKDGISAAIEKWMSGEVVFSHADLGGLMLQGDDAQEYKARVDDVYRLVAGKPAHISRGAVEDAVQNAMLRVLDIYKKHSESDFSARLTTEIGDLKKMLGRTPELHKVQLEVEGLNPSDLPRQVGQVKFFVADEATMPEIATNPTDSLDEAQRKRRESARALRKNIVSLIQGKTYAAMEVLASDLKAAEFLAEVQLRHTLDVLNYFSDFFSYGDARVFLPGDAARFRHVAVVGKKSEPETSRLTMAFKGPGPFSFPGPRANSNEVLAFDRASALLQKQNPNPLEKRILAALQWAGRASVEKRKEEAFLLYCISLEALLLKNEDKGEITFSFALRGAHLLLKDSGRRKEIFKDLKALYRLRSKVVHSGNTEISDSDLGKIRGLAKNAIFIVLTTEPFSSFVTEEQLEEWFQDQLLAGAASEKETNSTATGVVQAGGATEIKATTDE